MVNKTNIKMLGEGTYGRVSKAEYNGKKCAVKINMFHDWSEWGNGMINLIEYDILKRFSSHPLFLDLYDVCNRDSPFIQKVDEVTVERAKELYDRSDQRYDNIHFIMELGKYSLADLIEEVELNIDDVAKIVCDILLGLEFLHNNGVIHRDLKSSNVIIFEDNDDYVAKLCDFGMSKYYTDQDENSGSVATYTTRSPELVMKEKYGPPSDVWTVGCILYEILFDITPIDLGTKMNSKGEKVYKFDRRRALLSIFRYAHHDVSLENVNRILEDLKLKKTGKLERTTIEEMLSKLPEEGFFDSYTRDNLTQLLKGLLEFNQNKRITATQALELPFFGSQHMKEYIENVRKYNVKMDMLGRELKLTKCGMRSMIYDKIKEKYSKDRIGIFSTEERIDIHTIIVFERWLRALSKKDGAENLNKSKKDFDKYFVICKGIIEKLFNEGGKAPHYYINKVKQIEEEFGDWYVDAEEELVLHILEFPYEITPYELAVQRGLTVKGKLFRAIIEEMSNAVNTDEVMNMSLILDRAVLSQDKDNNVNNKRRIIPPKYKSKLPRNRK